MATPDSLSSIDEQAAYWAVEAAYSEMGPESRAELDAWLAADPRHRGAYVRVRAALYVMEDAVVGAHSAPAPPAVPAPAPDNDNATDHGSRGGFSRWRGRAVAGGVAVAACVAAMVAVRVPVVTPLPQARPAVEVVKLEDGSVATLSRDARIAVALSADYRRITLLSGEATFRVAHDKARPFVVRSGDVYAQATGTVYSVRRVGAAGGTVRVTEGAVLVWPREERDQAVLVHAGDAVTLNLGPKQPDRALAAPPPPPPALAQISLADVPIGVAAARFNRVNKARIVIADPAMASIRIDGLFEANDVEQFAQAAAALADGQVVHESGNIVIKSK